MGPMGAPWAPSPPVVLQRNFEKVTKNRHFVIFGSKIGPNQVHMAPFWLILIRFGSHMVQDASGMPPGAPGGPWGPKGAQGAPRGPKGPLPFCCGVALKGLLHKYSL